MGYEETLRDETLTSVMEMIHASLDGEFRIENQSDRVVNLDMGGDSRPPVELLESPESPQNEEEEEEEDEEEVPEE